jgi:hypothetical protein
MRSELFYYLSTLYIFYVMLFCHQATKGQAGSRLFSDGLGSWIDGLGDVLRWF